MRRTIINLLGILFMYMGYGQTQLSFEEATDTIFETWNNLDKPGIAAGVLKNGEIRNYNRFFYSFYWSEKH